jgi:hypothetical protein
MHIIKVLYKLLYRPADILKRLAQVLLLWAVSRIYLPFEKSILLRIESLN